MQEQYRGKLEHITCNIEVCQHTNIQQIKMKFHHQYTKRSHQMSNRIEANSLNGD